MSGCLRGLLVLALGVFSFVVALGGLLMLIEKVGRQ